MFTTWIIVYLPFIYQFTVKLIIVYNLELPFNYHLTISLTVKFNNQLQRMIYTDAWKNKRRRPANSWAIALFNSFAIKAKIMLKS
jgi:hypothetical protein